MCLRNKGGKYEGIGGIVGSFICQPSLVFPYKKKRIPLLH